MSQQARPSPLWTRRLAALVAVFAPDRAERLIALVSTSTSGEVAEHAVTLSRRSREERLAALAEAFPSAARTGVARTGLGNPLWERLACEALARLSRPSASRTEVRCQGGASYRRSEISRGNACPPGGTVHEDAHLR